MSWHESFFNEFNHFEILDEVSERICDMYRMETGRELKNEDLAILFENGKIVEIRSEFNEIIYEN